MMINNYEIAENRIIKLSVNIGLFVGTSGISVFWNRLTKERKKRDKQIGRYRDRGAGAY